MQTTVGRRREVYARMVSRSRKKSHIIAAKTTGIWKRIFCSRITVFWISIKVQNITGTEIRITKLPHIKFEGKDYLRPGV